ncbi:pyridoxal-phosphate dependent enzyme [Pseudomonas sp. RP23018S]|uniref:pyridoxal-phosphate dependent enzyme n=1 Tax=Pseudomonas sp. RP23018S TaxID=3096037 RepID=UPI002ACA59E8|nr:pyridoxal-phosphate dependent enzyme [Pseudomonas sp. RP23018S]MDZ5603932.1 pyridoxal-phosphate dependent enzyme [Pseudomonas sp. RP23018S]
MSKLIRTAERILTKLEMHNPGGSHKYRAAKHIIDCAVRNGDIIPGETTVIEKTGGNFGFGLIAACHRHNIAVELAVGLSFSQTKRDLLECFGATLIGKDMLLAGATPKDVVMHRLEQQAALGKSYFYTDQFNNTVGVDAHRYQTATELACQLIQARAGKELLFVGCAGTGASFSGITLGLRDQGFDVETVLVDPSGCDSKAGVFADHRFEGMAVGVTPPFLDWALVNQHCTVSQEQMLTAQRTFYMHSGAFVGNTAAACLAVAQRLVQLPEHAHKTVVTIAYDAGLWYQDLQKAGVVQDRRSPAGCEG